MDIFADILEQYPRDYQNCSLTMEDGQYATILGTIAKNSSSASFKFQRTVLTVHVDPEASRCKLDEFYEESPSGLHYPDMVALHPITLIMGFQDWKQSSISAMFCLPDSKELHYCLIFTGLF